MSNKWITALTKSFGKLASDIENPEARVVALPSPSMNWVVGNGGIAVGKAVTLFGPESGGKSLLMQLILIQLQKDNPEGICILFDAEMAFNPKWFKQLGGDTDRLIVRATNDPTKIFDYIAGDMNELVQDGAPIVGIAIDSIKSIRYPKDHKEVSTKMVMGGSGAAYLGSAFKMILPVIREHNITTVLVQQVYEEMDEMKKMLNPFVVPDGRSLKHFSDYMLEVTRLDTKAGRIEEGENIHGGNQQVGHKVRVRGKKNRVGAPFRTGQFSLHYTKGIINVGEEIFDLAKSLGVVYHPVNPDTGKENVQMWKVLDRPPVRGEANIKEIVVNDKVLQEEIIKACNAVDDAVIAKRNEELGIDDNDFSDVLK